MKQARIFTPAEERTLRSLHARLGAIVGRKPRAAKRRKPRAIPRDNTREPADTPRPRRPKTVLAPPA